MVVVVEQPGIGVRDTPPDTLFVVPGSALAWQYAFPRVTASPVDEATTEPHWPSSQVK